MKLDLITVKNDECYTPRYAVRPILKYIQRGSHVWCPFDTEESNFVKMLSLHGCQVTATHMQTGNDFFKTMIHADYIVSNPPYSIKGKVFARLCEIETPFAMLVGVVGLFESQQRFNMFANNDFEIMYFNKRVAYMETHGNAPTRLNPPFSSVYLTSRVLPSQIVFETIDKSDMVQTSL